MEEGESTFTSNAVREELAMASPLEAGRRSREDESRELCGLTNTWWTGVESIRDLMSRLLKVECKSWSFSHGRTHSGRCDREGD